MTAIPGSWEIRPLDEVADVRLGRQRSPKNHSGTQMRPYLRAANVDWDGLKLDDVKEMNFTDSEMDVYRLRPGDILLSEASGSPSEVGKPGLWSGEIADCAFQNTLLRVRSRGPEPRYLLHFLRKLAVTGEFAAESRGVGIHHIGRSKLAAWAVPLPPIEEQRRVVGTLEVHLSHLDAASDYVEAAQRRVATLIASVVATATTGADPVPLGGLAVASGYGTSAKCVVGGPGPAVVRIPNLVDGRIDLSDEKRVADLSVDVSRSQLDPDDLLIVRTNGSRDLIGRCSVVQRGIDAAFASYLIRYRLDRTRALPEWVRLVFASPASRARLEALAASSAGQYNLSLSKLDRLPVPLPSIQQQQHAVRRVDDIVAEIRQLGRAARVAAARANGLRRALLEAAFSGRLPGSAGDGEMVEEMAGV